MKLINTDGLAFIGPGSEWFWTAVSGLVLATTFIAIYRQLRLQRSQAAIDQVESFEREWASERMCRMRVDALVAYRNATDPADLDSPMAGLLVGYWEKVATLVRRGHIDHRLLWRVNGGNCEPWWIILAPSIRKARAEFNDPTGGANFEWLAGAMAELDRREGASPNTEASITAPDAIASRIAYNLAAIRMEEALRTVVLASPEPPPVGQSRASSAPAPAAAAAPVAEG